MIDRIGAAGPGPAAAQVLDVMPVSRWLYASSPGAVSASAAIGNGNLRVAPLLVTQDRVLTGIAGDISVVGSAGALLRLGVYADTGGAYPGQLVVDAGTISGTSATIQAITGLQAVLAAGLYWVGAVVQGAPTTQPTVRTISNWTPPCLLGGTSSLPTAGGTQIGYSMSGVTGALPASFSGTVSVASTVPRLLVLFGEV